MKKLYSPSKYPARAKKVSFQQKPLKQCCCTSEINISFLRGTLRIQLDPDRNSGFSEFVMGGCFEFLFALVVICHHWAQFYAALHCPWEAHCVLLPDASTLPLLMHLSRVETWCLGSLMWSRDCNTKSQWGEEAAVTMNSFWAPVNVRPWWEALSSCSMVMWLLPSPGSTSLPAVTETKSNAGRPVLEQWTGIMDQKTVLKLQEIQA